MELFTGCFSKYYIHYIWLIVICVFDLISVICTFVYYGVSDKQPIALASAIVMSVAFGGHCLIACYFYWFSAKKPKCTCTCVSEEQQEPDTKCTVYYGVATVLVVTLGFLQWMAAGLISGAMSYETTDEHQGLFSVILISIVLDGLISAFFICFVHIPVICC